MITSKELRLGNYILGFYEDEDGLEENEDVLFEAICKVTSLDCSGFLDFNIYVESDDCNVEVYEKFEGIELTEEWLLKFGFKRFPWGLVKDNLLFKDDLKCSYLILQVGNGFEVKVKYVHELQNLYFALTGSELTVA